MSSAPVEIEVTHRSTEAADHQPIGRRQDGPDHSVEAKNLTLGFGEKTILRDINVGFPRGTVTAIIGPTGTGKSVFVRTINRLNDHLIGFRHDGDVQFDGKSIWAQERDLNVLRRQIGMVFQRPNPLPMSISENVVIGVRAHRLVPKCELSTVAEQRLRQVGLWDAVRDRLDDSPYRLSGGQQQLLCLARALAVDPEVLILDEPTSSLDPMATAAIETLARSLTPALTIMIVTHNLAQAKRVSDLTMFFYQGVLVEHGATDMILTAPREEQTRLYVTGRFG